MLSSNYRKSSRAFFLKKILCYFLIINHIWLGCAQATNSIISDLDTQADERVWKHLAKRRVLIDPETTFNGEQALRLRTFSNELPKDLKEQQEEDESKTIILENNPVESLNLLLTPSNVNDLFPDMRVSDKGIYHTIEGLDLFISWKGKVWVRGGETDSLSLETKRSLIFTHPVKARGLTLKAEYCEILSALDVEEDLDVDLYGFDKGLMIGQIHEGNKGILSAKNMTLHEGDIHIEYGGALLLKEQGILDLNHNNLLNHSLLEALGDASIKNAGLLQNKFNMIAPQGNLTLGGRELRNEGAKIEGRNLSLNFEQLTNTNSDGEGDWDSPAIIMATENLSLEGKGTAINSGTLQGKQMMIQNKTLTNRHLIQAEQELNLIPGETFTNEKNGWIKVDGQGIVSGSGKVLNLGGRVALDDPLAEEHQPLEGAGMTFQNLLFQSFNGTLQNEGSWMTKEQVTGDIKTFVNQGTWKSSHTSLAIQQFETLLGATLQDSKIVGDGQWTIKTGVNRSLMQGEDLEILIQEDFDQKGVLQANQSLSFQGENVQNEGRIETQKLFWQGRQLVNLPAGNIEVKGKANLTLDKLDNGGILDFKDAVTAKVQKTKNRKGAALSFASDSLYTGKTFKKYGTLKGEGFLNLIMEEKADLHETTEMDSDLSIKGWPLNLSPESKTISKRKLSMEVSDEKGALQPLILKGKTEGKDQFKIKALNLHNTGDMISPGDTPLYAPEGFRNDKKAYLRHLDLTLNYGRTLHNTSTGEMILSSPVRLGQGGLFNNEGDAYIGKSDSSLTIPGKMIQDTACEFMTNYPDWSGHTFQHMSNSGNLTLMGGSWRVRGTLYNKGKGVLIPEAGVQLLYNGFGNDGKIVAPHGLNISSVNPKNPLRLTGGWQSDQLLNIHYPEIDVLGAVQALGGSRIQSNRMTLDDHSLWKDEGTSTLWDIRDEFRIKHTANMVMKDWHLKTGAQGYHYGNLEINGNALIEGTNFYHRGKTTGTGNLRATMVKEFDQIGTLGLEGNIDLDAPILFDYPYSQTWAEGELSLKTSYPLTGYWEGTKHFSWEGKTGQYVNMISSGTLVSPTQTTLMAPGSFNNRGVIQDNAKVSLWNINNEFRNDGQMVVNNWHLKTGKQGYHFGEMEIKGQALIEGDNFYHKGKTWGKGHLTALMNKEFDQIGKINLGGNIKLHAPILFDYPHSKTRAGSELDLKTSYPLRGYWEGTKKLSWTEQYSPTYPVLRSSGILFSPQETNIYAGHGMLNEGTADLTRLSLLISPGSTLTNTGEMFLNQPVSLGYDFNIQNKGIFKAGNLSSPSSALSYMVFDPKETFYGKNSLDWVNGKAPWHLVRNIDNQGDLLLSDSGKYWKVSGDILNAPAKVWSLGGGLRLRAKNLPKNAGKIQALTDGEVDAHMPFIFTGEWFGEQNLSFVAQSIINPDAKVRTSKEGILKIVATYDDVTNGQAKSIIKKVREAKAQKFKNGIEVSANHVYLNGLAHWVQSNKKLGLSGYHGTSSGYVESFPDKKAPPVLTGGTDFTDGETSASFLTQNGALFQGGKGLIVQAKRDVLNHFGLMHSPVGFIELGAERTADNLTGTVLATKDISINAYKMRNRLSDQMVSKRSDYTLKPDYGFWWNKNGDPYLQWVHPASDPALIASIGGDIHFKITEGENYASRILGGKNVLFHGKSAIPSSFNNHNAQFRKEAVFNWTKPYIAWIGQYYGSIQAGQSILINDPQLNWAQAGVMNAPLNVFNFKNMILDEGMEGMAHKMQDALALPEGRTHERIVINLGEMLQHTLIEALNEGQQMNPRQSLLSDKVAKDSIIPVQRTGNLSPLNELPLYLGSQALQVSLMQALSSLAGTLNITKEMSLEGQMRALHRAAKEQVQGKGQIVLKESDIKEFKKSFIGYVAQKIGDVQTLVAQLYLHPQDINVDGLEPASISGDDLIMRGETLVNKGLISADYDINMSKMIAIQKPVMRYSKWVEETVESGGFFGSSKTTMRKLDYAIPARGGILKTKTTGQVKQGVLESDVILLEGAHLEGGDQGIQMEAKQSLVMKPVIKTDYEYYQIEKSGSFGGHYGETGHVIKQDIIPVQIISKGTVIGKSQGKTHLEAPQVKVTQGEIQFTSKDEFLLPGAKALKEDKPTLSIEGTKINKTISSKEIGKIAKFEAPKVTLESLEGKISGVRPNILSKDPQIRARSIELMEEKDFLKTLKKTQKTFVVGSTVDPGLMMVMSAAITVATGGVGVNSLGAALAKAMAISAQSSPVMFAMVSAGANALANQTILSGIVNKGDLGEVVKEITSEDSLKSLGITIASAGIGAKLELKAPTGKAGFEKHLTYQAKKALIDNGLKGIVKGEKLEEALKNAGMQTIVNAFASYGAQRIGDAYAMGSKDMDYLTHKLLHAALGGTTGALLGDDVKKGLISGAMSAMVAEVIAEAVAKPQEVGIEILDKAHKEGRILSEQEYFDAVDQELRPLMDKIKIVTGVLALASGQDVGIAMKTSENALENNALPMMMAAAYGAYKVASVAYVAYDAYATYQNEGVEAAVQKLLVDGAIAVAVGQGIKGGFYLVGNVAYPTAKAAWSAYVAQSPLMMKIIEGGSHQLGKIKEQVGKGYNKVKDKILDGERKELPKLSEEAKQKMHGISSTDVPQNRVTYEKYLAEKRAELTREEVHSVQDSELKKLMQKVYKETDKIWGGGTGNAVRYERATGQSVGGRDHSQKAKDYSKALENWLINHPSKLSIHPKDLKDFQDKGIIPGSSHDRQVAEQVLKELKNSLGMN